MQKDLFLSVVGGCEQDKAAVFDNSYVFARKNGNAEN